MTTTTTPRDLLSPVNGADPKLDSPAVSALARARLTATQSDGNSKTRRRSIGARVRGEAGTWWMWVEKPASLADAWRASKVDARRIPNNSAVLRALWWISNGTDRVLMFALILWVPSLLAGPARFLATRPTRRWSLYLTLTALITTYFIGRN